MDIIRKKFEDISYEDVENLVMKKFEETDVLEYKEKYNPKDFDKLISSFANTYGGIIIIGVKEKKGTSQPEKIVNVRNSDLENAIDSICWRNISPPVSCDRKYLQKPGGRTKIFVIKVYESDLTPHTVDFGTTVYYRAKGQKYKDDNFKKADLDHILWLRNKREKYVGFRKLLIERSRARAYSLFGDSIKRQLYSECIILPKYPQKSMISERELLKYIRKDEEINSIDVKTAYNSVSFINHQKRENYSEFNTFGGYCNFALKRHTHINMPKWNDQPIIVLNEILGNIITNLFFGQRFLGYLSAQGQILISYKLINIKNKNIVWENERLGTPQPQYELKSLVDNTYEFNKEIDTASFISDYSNIFRDIVDNIVFSLGGGDLYDRADSNNASKIIEQIYLN